MKLKDLGRLVATRSVADLQESSQEFAIFVNVCLGKYLNNDWGDLAKDDKKMNDHAVVSGDERIMASYLFPPNTLWYADNSDSLTENKLWIITEWDRSVTTILFPDEY